jgi:hypothetical protein
MFEKVRYTYRLRPCARAERALLDEWHRCRFLWNEAVHQQKSGNRCSAIARQRLRLGERTFRCEHCGYTADRDRNAARTILATVDPDRAGVDDIRHDLPPSKDAGGAVRVRNPPASAVGKG